MWYLMGMILEIVMLINIIDIPLRKKSLSQNCF
ncbi:hypothetical protein D1AOALGA4SA_5233 [Olavius algarvensis Delta 1 endosymbiont]|nr:hypothetical protein D1AOALGA4SA_5233 [Olavius algarvensis Delta 1 endosymbiont]